MEYAEYEKMYDRLRNRKDDVNADMQALKALYQILCLPLKQQKWALKELQKRIIMMQG